MRIIKENNKYVVMEKEFNSVEEAREYIKDMYETIFISKKDYEDMFQTKLEDEEIPEDLPVARCPECGGYIFNSKNKPAVRGYFLADEDNDMTHLSFEIDPCDGLYVCEKCGYKNGCYNLEF